MSSQFEQQQTSGGEETRARYSQEEISAILEAAQARSQSDPSAALDLPYQGGIEDALEVARSLNIPEEHVQAAAREILARRRAVAVQRKPAPAWLAPALGFFVGMGCVLLLVASPFWLKFFGLGLALSSAVAWVLMQLASRGSGVAGEKLPVAGVCRVCSQPAYDERATFCEEHRYRGPGG